MITFPEFTNYQSTYTTPSYNRVVEFTVFDDKTNEIETSIKFHLCVPMTNEEVYNYCDSRIPNDIRSKILLGVRDYKDLEDNKLDRISIWKLDWYLRNIRRNRIVNITIHRKNDSDITYKINADDEYCVDKLIKIIKNNAY